MSNTFTLIIFLQITLYLFSVKMLVQSDIFCDILSVLLYLALKFHKDDVTATVIWG